mgnify:CR=1 FL=1
MNSTYYPTFMRACSAHGRDYGEIKAKLALSSAIDGKVLTAICSNEPWSVVRGQVFGSIKAAAEHFGVDDWTVRRKMNVFGDSITQEQVDECFAPHDTHTRNPIPIRVLESVFDSHTQASEAFGLSQSAGSLRLSRIDTANQRAVNACFCPCMWVLRHDFNGSCPEV